MCSDRGRPSGSLLAAASLLFFLTPACGEARGRAETRIPVVRTAPDSSRRALTVLQPRGVVRVPFKVRLNARMETEERCEVVLDLQAPQGGPAEVEFSLPEEFSAVEGEILRRPVLRPDEVRRERLLVQVPPEGHYLVGVTVTIDGRRSEAFVRFGEPPTAEERGLRTRRGAAGDRVLRIGPEDLRDSSPRRK